jgi:hypothetical protein
LGIETRAPMNRSWQPAARALKRAALTVKPVIRGAWHDARVVAPATVGADPSVNGTRVASVRNAIHDLGDRLTTPP